MTESKRRSVIWVLVVAAIVVILWHYGADILRWMANDN